MRKIILLLLIIFLLHPLISCNGEYKKISALRVTFFDVDQGDSILIEYKDKKILIDGGPEYTEKKLKGYLKEKKIKKLDYVIATHPHEDHIGGLDKIIKSFKIGNFYAPKKIESTKSFYDVVKALRDKNLKIYNTSSPYNITLDNEAGLYFLSPDNDTYDNTNNYSIVILLKYKDVSFLFAGDAEKEIEEELLLKYKGLKAQVLKLGHHGSKTSSSMEFISSLSPNYGVISCGLGNDYNHPSKEVLATLKELKVIPLRTDLQGTIVIESDGSNIHAP